MEQQLDQANKTQETGAIAGEIAGEGSKAEAGNSADAEAAQVDSLKQTLGQPEGVEAGGGARLRDGQGVASNELGTRRRTPKGSGKNSEHAQAKVAGQSGEANGLPMAVPQGIHVRIDEGKKLPLPPKKDGANQISAHADPSQGNAFAIGADARDPKSGDQLLGHGAQLQQASPKAKGSVVGQHKTALVSHHAKDRHAGNASGAAEHTTKHKENAVRTITINNGTGGYNQAGDGGGIFKPIQGTQLRLRLRNEGGHASSKLLDPGASNESHEASGSKFKSGGLEVKDQFGHKQNLTQENQTQVRRESLGPIESLPGSSASPGCKQSYFGDTQKSLHSQGYSQAMPNPIDAASIDGSQAPEENVLGEPDEYTQAPTKFQKMMNQTYEILSGLPLSPVAEGGRHHGKARGGGTTAKGLHGYHSILNHHMKSNQLKQSVMKPLRLEHLIQSSHRTGLTNRPKEQLDMKMANNSQSLAQAGGDAEAMPVFRSNKHNSQGQALTVYQSSGMSVQDTQRLKEIKNYRFGQGGAWKHDKQRMLEGFKTEIQFMQNTQRSGRGDRGQVGEGATRGYSASQKHLSVQQIEAIKHQLEGEIRNNLNGIALDGSEATTLTQIQNIGEITQRYLENQGIVPNAMQTYTTMSSKGNDGARASPALGSGATTAGLGTVGDTLNMMNSSLGLQGSIITLDRAKVHEDNEENARNIRKFGVARHGEYKKKQTSNLVHSVDLKMHQRSFKDSSTFNMPSYDASKRGSPTLPPVNNSPANFKSELSQAKDYLELNDLTKANSSLSNAVNYKDNLFFSSTRNSRVQKSIIRAKHSNAGVDKINLNYKFIPASVGSAPARQTQNSGNIRSFLSNQAQLNKPGQHTLAVDGNNVVENVDVQDANIQNTATHPTSNHSSIHRSTIQRGDAEGLPRAPPLDRDPPDVQSGSTKKFHHSVHGSTDYHLNEIQKHLKTVRLQNLADYQKTKEERLSQMTSFKSKYAFRYQAHNQRRGPQVARSHFEWDNELQDQLTNLAMNEHPKTFKAANLLRANRLVLPRVAAPAVKSSVMSPFSVKNVPGDLLMNSREVPGSREFQESPRFEASRQELEEPYQFGSDLAEQTRNPTQVINKRNLTLLSQSCDYEARALSQLKKTDAMRTPQHRRADQESPRQMLWDQQVGDEDRESHHYLHHGWHNHNNDAVLSDRDLKLSDAGRSQHNQAPCSMARTFLINGRHVDMPTENQQSIDSKFLRVSNMAQNLHQIKQSVRDQFLLQQRKQLENFQSFQQEFGEGGPNAPLPIDQFSSRHRASSMREDLKKRSSYALSLDFMNSVDSTARKPDAAALAEADADLNPLEEGDENAEADQQTAPEKAETAGESIAKSAQPTRKQRAISPTMQDEILTALDILENLEQQKAQAKEDWLKLLQDKGRNIAPDYEEFRRQFKARIQKLREQVIRESSLKQCKDAPLGDLDKEFDANSHIYSTNDKFKFQKAFDNNTYLAALAEKDPEFEDMMKETNPIIKVHLNQIFESIFEHFKYSNLTRQEFIRRELFREIRQALLARRLAQRHADKNKEEERFKKKDLKTLVMSCLTRRKTFGIGEQLMKHGQARRELNPRFVWRVKNLENQLKAVFRVGPPKTNGNSTPGGGQDDEPCNLGRKYDALGQNVFSRTDGIHANQKGKAGALVSNHIRNAQRQRFSSFFFDIQQKQIFYDQAKDGKQDDGAHDVNQIMLKYFERIRDNLEVPMPTFAHPMMSQNTLFLRELILTDNVSLALKSFLEDTKDLSECWVKSIVIDGCKMSDEAFQNIIDGIAAQGKHLTAFNCSNGSFSEASLHQLTKVMPTLHDLALCNLKNAKSSTLGNISLPKPNTEDNKFYEALHYSRLLKLKFSKLNLSNDEKMLEELCNYIRNSHATAFYDLSWNQMQAKELNAVMAAFNTGGQPQIVRAVNLSYNTLDFELGQHAEGKVVEAKRKTMEYSNSFLNNLLEFLQHEDMELNHIDLSGMQLQRDQLVKICHALVKMPHMSAAHLNDNGINNFGRMNTIDDENETKLELMDIFGIHPTALEQNPQQQKNRPLKFPDIIEQKVRETVAAKYDLNNYVDVVDKTQAYKETLANQKLSRHIGNAKFLNQQHVNSGASRLLEDSLDVFTVTRAANHPELVFSAAKHLDSYFEKDVQQKWTLADRGACHICRKHQYIAVMYQQGADAENPDLLEIKDRDFILGLQQSLNMDGLEMLSSMVPFIMGTLVNPAYARKLKMIRSELFAALSISQATAFVTQRQQMDGIKLGVMELVEGGQQDIERIDDLAQRLVGWNKVVHNLLNQNNLTDVVSINQPKDLDKKAPESGTSFIFAGFYPAGHHAILIYDPKSQRAFVKDVVVNLNSFDNYPEFPRMTEKAKRDKPNQNVWRKWVDDSDETEVIVYMNDLTSGFHDPKVVVKNEEELAQLHEFFKRERKIFKIFFREMIANSSVYPRLKYEDILNHILSKQLDKQDSERFPRSFIELSFQKAADKQNVRGLKGKLCRAEFFNFLVRCVHQYSPKNIYQGLMDFTAKYILPTYNNSDIPRHREQIRQSEELNDLLLKNQASLTNIFHDFSEKDKKAERGFTQQSAIRLIQLCSKYNTAYAQASAASNTPRQSTATLPGSGVASPGTGTRTILSTEVALQCFAFSLMTIQNEQTSGKKYMYLYYVEFLEFLCRVALNLDAQQRGKTSSTQKRGVMSSNSNRRGTASGEAASRSAVSESYDLSTAALNEEMKAEEDQHTGDVYLIVLDFLKLLYEARKQERLDQGKGRSGGAAGEDPDAADGPSLPPTLNSTNAQFDELLLLEAASDSEQDY